MQGANAKSLQKHAGRGVPGATQVLMYVCQIGWLCELKPQQVHIQALESASRASTFGFILFCRGVVLNAMHT
jgi:hypothetical protein